MDKPLFGLASFKLQNLVVSLGILFLLGFSYRYSIGKTLAMRRLNSQLSEKLAVAGQAPSEIAVLKSDLAMLENSALIPYDRGLLLEKVSLSCRALGLLIRNFPKETQHESNGYIITTNLIETEGDFESIIQLVYKLEREERLGNINSLSFYILEDRYEKTRVLIGRLIIRNVMRKSEEHELE